MTWQRWTPEEDQRVVDMANDGASYDEIAEALKSRTYNSVSMRVAYLRETLGAGAFPARLRDPRQVRSCKLGRKNIKAGGRGESHGDSLWSQRPRICLSCGHSFESAHCMNRLCNTCRRQSPSPYAP